MPKTKHRKNKNITGGFGKSKFNKQKKDNPVHLVEPTIHVSRNMYDRMIEAGYKPAKTQNNWNGDVAFSPPSDKSLFKELGEILNM